MDLWGVYRYVILRFRHRPVVRRQRGSAGASQHLRISMTGLRMLRTLLATRESITGLKEGRKNYGELTKCV